MGEHEKQNEEKEKKEELPYTPHGVLKFSQLVAEWLKKEEEENQKEGEHNTE